LGAVLYATRYCVGRRTYAVSDCVAYLRTHWAALSLTTQYTIQRDVAEAIERDCAGDLCDIAAWRTVLALPAPEHAPYLEDIPRPASPREQRMAPQLTPARAILDHAILAVLHRTCC
jgi:hypothetical protein